jgi:hypothetical protein
VRLIVRRTTASAHASRRSQRKQPAISSWFVPTPAAHLSRIRPTIIRSVPVLPLWFLPSVCVSYSFVSTPQFLLARTLGPHLFHCLPFVLQKEVAARGREIRFLKQQVRPALWCFRTMLGSCVAHQNFFFWRPECSIESVGLAVLVLFCRSSKLRIRPCSWNACCWLSIQCMLP